MFRRSLIPVGILVYVLLVGTPLSAQLLIPEPQRLPVEYRLVLADHPGKSLGEAKKALEALPAVDTVHIDSEARALLLKAKPDQVVSEALARSTLESLGLKVAEYRDPQALFYTVQVKGG